MKEKEGERRRRKEKDGERRIWKEMYFL